MLEAKTKKIATYFLVFCVFALLVYVSLLLTQFVTDDSSSQLLIREFGYIGIILISFVSGINFLVPVPASTFIPIFTAGGIALPVAIILLVIGTMSANILTYYIGRAGHKLTKIKYPTIQEKILSVYENKKHLLPYFVFLFAALIPFPNEVYLIPLGIIGIKLKVFILPLLSVTILFQSLTALGFQNVFDLFLK